MKTNLPITLTEINIKKEEDYLEIDIVNKNKSKVKIVYLLFTSIFSFGLFMLFIFRGVHDVREIGFSVFFFLIFVMFFKPLLWIFYGKEQIRITPLEVHQIIDFGWFKDQTKILNKNVALEIDLQKRLKKTSEHILDSDLEKYQHDGIIRFKKNRNVLIEIEAEISKSDLGTIEEAIQKYLR